MLSRPFLIRSLPLAALVLVTLFTSHVQSQRLEDGKVAFDKKAYATRLLRVDLFAAKANADLSRWTFATGPADEVSRAVVLGFKVSAAKVARQAGDYDVIHGNWLVLVDRKGDFRGYYQVEGDRDFEALLGDVKRVEREK